MKWLLVAMQTILLLSVCHPSKASQQNVPDKRVHQDFPQAQKFMGLKNYDAAIAAFKKIVREEPEFSDAYEWLALAYVYGQRTEKGLADFLSLVKHDSLNANVYLGLGKYYQKIDENSKALASYKRAMKLGGKYPPLLFNAVDAWKRLGKLDEAVSFFENLASQDKGSGLAEYGLACVYYRQNKWAKAEQHIDLALQDHDFPEAELLKAMILNQQGGKSEKVIELCKVGMEHADKKMDLEMKANFLGEMGLAYKYVANYSDALKSLEHALRIDKEVGSIGDEGIRLGHIGNLFLSDPNRAIPYFQKSLNLLRKVGDRDNEGKFINSMGIAYARLGKYDEAKKYYENTVKIAKEVGNLMTEARALNSIGIINFSKGDYPTALKYYEKALEIIMRMSNKVNEGRLLNNMANVAQRMGDYRRASRYYKKSLKLFKDTEDKSSEGATYGNLAIVCANLGNFAISIEYYEKAKRIAEETKDKVLIGRVLGNMGDLSRRFGDYHKALSLSQKALQIYEEIENKEGGALKHLMIGLIYMDIYEYSKAIEHCKKALEIYDELGDKGGYGTVTTNIGRLYGLIGEHSKALQYYQKGLSIARELGEKRNEGYACNHLGSYYLEKPDYAKSKQFFKRALRIGEIINVPEIVWDARTGLAVVLGKQDRVQEAWNQYRNAIGTIEDVENNISTVEGRMGFRERRQSGYEQLMSMLWGLHKQNPTKNFDKEMFYLAGRTRAQSLLELVTEGKVFQFLDEVSPDFRGRFLANTAKLGELREEWSRTSAQTDSSLALAIQKRLRAAESQHGQVLSKIKQEIPKYYDLITPNVLTVEQAQLKVLNGNQLLLQYFVGENNTYAFSVTRNDFSVTVLDIGAEDIARMLKVVSPLFQRKEESALLTSKDNIGITPVRENAGWAQIAVDGLHELYKRIFEPAIIKDHSPEGKELIIIPDDILFYFPFEMMVAKFEQNKPHYLLEDHAISYSASASLLNPEVKRRRTPDREILALGNPAFDTKSSGGASSVFAKMFKSIFRDGSWTPLPFSENEVRQIAANFKDAELLIGKNATEKKFRKNAARFRYLHLATHYLVDDRQPMFSKIVLAQNSNNTTEDGFLHTYEVFNLNLNAELVALSACNTALGKFSRGEGLMGISRAFMYAGVPSLVVSLWQVEDESTAFLMSQFYKYLAAGMAKNLSLQKAKIDLIHSNLEKNSPFYWAPFVLLGDPQ